MLKLSVISKAQNSKAGVRRAISHLVEHTREATVPSASALVERQKPRLRPFSAFRWPPLLAIFVILQGLACAPAAHAQQVLQGRYRCLRVEAQNQSAPCQSPPLVLNRDGSYQIWGERGTYEVVGGRWLVLSHSHRRGRGQFLPSGEIVFEYQLAGTRTRVTFRRLFDVPHGVSQS
jgi:hypothetical protein